MTRLSRIFRTAKRFFGTLFQNLARVSVKKANFLLFYSYCISGVKYPAAKWDFLMGAEWGPAHSKTLSQGDHTARRNVQKWSLLQPGVHKKLAHPASVYRTSSDFTADSTKNRRNTLKKKGELPDT